MVSKQVKRTARIIFWIAAILVLLPIIGVGAISVGVMFGIPLLAIFVIGAIAGFFGFFSK